METLQTKGMHCSACEMLLKEVLEDEGATSVQANHETGSISFNDLSIAQAKSLIEAEGYDVL